MKKINVIQPLILLMLLLLGCTDSSLTLLVRFPDISGLKQDDPVYFGSNDIGKVAKVTYTRQGDYLVEVRIAPEFKNAATRDSLFYIEAAPRGTSMAVRIDQQRPGGDTLEDGTTVNGSVRQGYVADLLDKLAQTGHEAERRLNRTLESLQQSLDNSSVELDSTLETALDDLSRRLDTLGNEIGKLPDSREMQQLEKSLERFADAFRKAGNDIQEHIRSEVLPRLRLELQHLDERLKREGRDQERERIDRRFQGLEMV